MTRKVLAEEPDRNAVVVQMARLTDQAADDLELPTPALLYPRFVTWLLRRDAACRACGKAGHDVIPELPPRFVPCEIFEVLRGGA